LDEIVGEQLHPPEKEQAPTAESGSGI